MPEDKRKLCVWVPDNLYSNVVNAGYTSPTSAVIQGFERLLGDNKCQQETSTIMANYTNLLAENSNLKKEIERLNTALLDAPKQVELVELRANLMGIQRLLEDKDDLIRSLESQLLDVKEQMRVKDHQLEAQAIHLQTVLNQKAIEAPGAKKPWWRFW